MQTALSRFWTQIAMSISYHDNHYMTDSNRSNEWISKDFYVKEIQLTLKYLQYM